MSEGPSPYLPTSVRQARVRFSHEGLEVTVPLGTTLREAARKAGAELYSGLFKVDNCHGHGRCGECRTVILAGLDRLGRETKKERKAGRPRGRRENVRRGNDPAMDERLACQTVIVGDVSVWTRARDGHPLKATS
jgi:ferredoxin